MDNKLLIKILETLEGTSPEMYHVEILAKKLNTSMDGEFYKIIKYLKESKKVRIILIKDPSDKRERFQQGDEVFITNEGIDFLADKKLLESNHMLLKEQTYFNKIIAITGSIIAFVMIFNFIINLSKLEFIENIPYQWKVPVIIFTLIIAVFAIIIVFFLINFIMKEMSKK